MNQVNQVSCLYLSPNKTIETLLISSNVKESTVYIYNFKGLSFRVFKSKESLDGFWKGLNNEDLHFNSEKNLDNWLKLFKIS
jgi:hypothetical protein